MTQNPENQTSAPREASTLLVSRLRTTLDTQWHKFDSSLPIGKGFNQKYQSMKSGYEQLKADLAKIHDDEVLKKDTLIQSKLDDFLAKIAKHLADTSRDKQYDTVLTETQSQVATLRSEIYGKTPDTPSSSQEVPNPALLAVGGIGGAALASGSALDASKVAEGVQSQIGEATKGFRGWIAEKVKEPGMMGDIFRDLEKKATSWVKDLSTPPSGSWLDSPWEHMQFQFKKWFAPLLAGWFGINLDGTKPGETPAPDIKNEKLKDKAQEVIHDESYRLTALYLLKGQDTVEYTNVISASIAGIKDATVGKDDLKKQEAVLNTAVNIFLIPEVRTQTYSQLISSGAEGVQKKLTNVQGELAKGASELVIKMLKNNESFLDKIFKNTDPDWRNKPIEHIISTLYLKHGYNSMEALKKGFHEIKMENVSDISKLPKHFFGTIDITANPPKFGGILSQKFDQLKQEGLTFELSKILLSDDSSSDLLVANAGVLLDGKRSDPEKAFLKKLLDEKTFLTPFLQSIEQNFGFPKTLTESLSSKNLTMRDIFELYAIMGGQTDVKKIPQGDRGLLMAKLQFLFAKNNINAYSSFLVDSAKTPDKYQEFLRVAQMVNTAVNKTTYLASRELTEGTIGLLNAIAGPLGIDTTGKKIAAALGVSAAALSIVVGAFMLFPPGIAILALGAFFTALGYTIIALIQKFIGTTK